MFCTRCGSGNHTSYDCSKPDQKLSPPQKAVTSGYVAGTETPAKSGKRDPLTAPSLEDIFESVPRFKGCPPICTHANLPSFPDESILLKWQGQFEGHHIKKRWLCDRCKHWHFTSVGRGPSGVSNGGERDSEMLANWRPPKIKALPPSRLGDDLPRHEVKLEPNPLPEKKNALQGQTKGRE